MVQLNGYQILDQIYAGNRTFTFWSTADCYDSHPRLLVDLLSVKFILAFSVLLLSIMLSFLLS